MGVFIELKMNLWRIIKLGANSRQFNEPKRLRISQLGGNPSHCSETKTLSTTNQLTHVTGMIAQGPMISSLPSNEPITAWPAYYFPKVSFNAEAFQTIYGGTR